MPSIPTLLRNPPMPRSEPARFARWLKEVAGLPTISVTKLAKEASMQPREVRAVIADHRDSTKGQRRDLYEAAIALLERIDGGKPSPMLPKAGSIQAYFTGNAGEHTGLCLNELCDAIRSAETEVLVMAYRLSSKRFLAALQETAEGGVPVRVIHDGRVFRPPRSTKVTYLADRTHTCQHNKVLLIDGKLLYTGSFNFTEAADSKNAENLIRCTDPAIVAQFAAYWSATYRQLRGPTDRKRSVRD